MFAAQAVHVVDPSGAKNPRGQQTASPRPLLLVPLEHGAQSAGAAPSTVVKEPAAHGEHVGAPSYAVKSPSAQHVAAPGAEKLVTPAPGQGRHADAARRPAEGEKLLRGHGMQLFGCCANVPGGHVVFLYQQPVTPCVL